jgi:curved DNA-binding protein CbpA
LSDLYAVLGVERTADLRSIRDAYRRRARRHHPDLGGDQQRMMALNKAWHVLRDPERRAAYDAKLARPRTKHPRTRDGHTVLDFGRYEGWSLGEIAAHDDNYLEWLSRTQTGRALRREIREVLASQAQTMESLRPAPVATKPRRFGRQKVR